MNEQKSPPPPGFADPPPPYQATYDGVNFQHGAPWGVPGNAAPAGVDSMGAPPGYPTATGQWPPPTAPGQWPPPTTAARVTVVNVTQAGPYPIQLTCPKCGAHVLTSTTYRPGLLTWLLSGALVLLGCWMGCCLIPCCVPECHDVDHHCPSCKSHLCTYQRL
ncbi:lipopolysaccharide-induced tumor necrosis factor-alpha factor homolog [Ixodes scapularis]|uniref:lipopolysaccharide-induced tumor necrosis factor-alpha factor homolog n=1 Tax=Ixodes scapularis TaxID=6945 RepID=UPI001A9FA98C|nr:lipopolysaccharide-induced tumor necrosis factor-alpha factor homolog [Ixodes scapularis]XP_029844101.2 lipopolysaccharide-induced tumor necrosis factor-alpha factor homolog [Ixodes scapularis]XP_029844102.2 lipopolysaccharide-induced tumor necrosis factor-alpha factor homolog [Ixodes scapularis]XP_029844103.2 lipopolysaccharide-induced tumor necrosis factor-alpha factor homolog [Ixodes scapularis]XP_029844104.2 lipopolysaccharide-induced tumor necrosis factor-alpha factor homolog [Ixodes sc